jgi:integrase
MAGLKTDANGNKLVTFRYGGKQFTKSAGTKDQAMARRIKSRVETTIFELTQGFIELPDGADAGEFIVTGGKRAEKPVLVAPAKGLTLGNLFHLYDEHFPSGAKAGTTKAMEGFHRNHLLRLFGPESIVETMSLADAQNNANRRSRETYRERPILPPTISKELSTLRVIWNWALKRGDLMKPVAFKMRDLSFDRTDQKAPFQTFDDIQRAIGRGKMGKAEEATIWECLYLNLEEVYQVLAYVRENARHPFILPMFAFAALTGARRSEICRSRIEDWNLQHRKVNIREMKRKRGRSSFGDR